MYTCYKVLSTGLYKRADLARMKTSWYVRICTDFKPPPRRGLQTGLDSDLKGGLACLHEASF